MNDLTNKEKHVVNMNHEKVINDLYVMIEHELISFEGLTEDDYMVGHARYNLQSFMQKTKKPVAYMSDAQLERFRVEATIYLIIGYDLFMRYTDIDYTDFEIRNNLEVGAVCKQYNH